MTLSLTRTNQPSRSGPRSPALLPSPPAAVPDPLNSGFGGGSSRRPLTPTRAQPQTVPNARHAAPFKTAQLPQTGAATATATAKGGQTPAEAYARAHQPRRLKDESGGAGSGNGRKEGEQVTSTGRDGSRGATMAPDRDNIAVAHAHPAGGAGTGGVAGGSNTKPILEWISRKLGGHRRASIAAEPSRNVTSLGTAGAATATSDGRSKYPSLPRNIRHSNAQAHGAGIVNIAEPPSKKRADPPAPAHAVSALPNGAKDLSLITHPAGLTASRTPTAVIPSRPVAAGQRLSPTQIFPQTPARESVLSRSESHSLQSYSLFSASPSERDRRTEANNPYPSMPIQMYRPRGSIMTASTSAWASASIFEREGEEEGEGEPSISYRSRSRTPSLRSERSISSSLRPRISIAEGSEAGDSSLRRRLAENGVDGADVTEAERDAEMGDQDDDAMSGSRSTSAIGMRTPRGADENASIRPLPPSHPSSPTPSQSILSRSASASLLSPRPGRSRTPPSPFRALSSSRRHLSNSSIGNSQHSDPYEEIFMPGRQSRQDSSSTKPTTIISFDSGHPVAHIAQVTPLSPASTAGASAALPSAAANAAPLAPPISGTAPAGQARSAAPAPVLPPLLPPVILSSPLVSSPASSMSNGPAPPSPLRSSFSRMASDALIGYTGPSTAQTDTPDETPQPSPPLNSDIREVSPLYHAQAPKHTLPHPIHNPRPSSPPPDNASTLTLASSTFAFPAPASSAGDIAPASGTGRTTASLHRSSIGRLSMSSFAPNSAGGPATPVPAHGASATVTGNTAPSDSGPVGGGTNIGSGSARPILSASPSVTFAPMPETHNPGAAGSAGTGQGFFNHHHHHHHHTASNSYIPHRPSSLAPSHRSAGAASADIPVSPDGSDTQYHHLRYPAPPLASPYSGGHAGAGASERELATAAAKEYPPSLHPTLGTRASGYGYGWPGRPDEGASTRAVRRKGSEGSVASFESRWSWRGTGGGAGAGQGGSNVVSPGGMTESRAGSVAATGTGRRVSEYSYVLPSADGVPSRSGSLVH